MFLVIDNYDSFVYNIVQYLGQLGVECSVFRNDEVSVSQARELTPTAVVVSPGPGRPEGAGVCVDLIRELAGSVPILGVCLGHQCVGHAFGAEVVHASEPVHGKVSRVRHDGKGLFSGIPDEIGVARYHSLVVSREGLPNCFVQTAHTPTGELMGLRHRSYPIEGVQFHPESIVTEHGLQMIENFIGMVEQYR